MALGAALSLEQAADAFATLAVLSKETAPGALPLAARVSEQESFGLTVRETEVASLIAQGKSNRAIAAALVIEIKTVEAYVSRILIKCGFSSRSQIVAWAIANGLAPHNSDHTPVQHEAST